MGVHVYVLCLCVLMLGTAYFLVYYCNLLFYV